ncbi:MAG: hypothetical protein FWG80_01650 [Alphaproteobacteria bacterium]|nr:hypothetical protein [Alphaproteobacteria bacterium]
MPAFVKGHICDKCDKMCLTELSQTKNLYFLSTYKSTDGTNRAGAYKLFDRIEINTESSALQEFRTFVKKTEKCTTR